MKTCPLCSATFVPRLQGRPQIYCSSCISSGAAKRFAGRSWSKAHPGSSRAWMKAHPEYLKAWSLAHPGYGQAQTSAWRRAHPEQHKATCRRAVLRKYGLTPDAFLEAVSSQSGLCAICHRPPPAGKPLYVDHDHTSGKVRSLLCRACNTAVGLMETSEVLRHRQEAQYDLPPSKEK
jgi:hypothetical protein